ERLGFLQDRVRVRLGELASWLGEADWLHSAFSAADLLMVTVLRRLGGSGEVEKYSNLAAYVARGEARPAYQRAFAAQLAVFAGKPSSSISRTSGLPGFPSLQEQPCALERVRISPYAFSSPKLSSAPAQATRHSR